MTYTDFIKKTASVGSVFLLAIALSSYHLHRDWLETLSIVLVMPIMFSFLLFFEFGGLVSGFLSAGIYLVLSILYRTDITDVTSYYLSLALTVLIFIFLGVGGGRIALAVKEIFSELEQQRLLNKFTGLYTSEYLINLIQRHINEYERYDSPFSLILLEITPNALQSIKGIKRENVLIKIGLALREGIRMIDEVARHDNQFLLVLPHTSLSGSEAVDKRIKKTIGQILKDNYCSVQNSEAVYSITVAYPENKEEMEKLLEAIRSSATLTEV